MTRSPFYGLQEKYLVLSEEERAKGFVRPVRLAYKHAKCCGVTKIGTQLSETYAKNPGFYDGAYCSICRKHFPLKDADGSPAFLWDDDDEAVGS